MRIDEPLQALARLTPTEVRISYPPKGLTPRQNGVIIFQRMKLTQPQATIAHLCRLGYVTVLEYDDHPCGFDSHVSENYYSFGCYHAVQTSTPAIADFLISQGITSTVGAPPNQLAEAPPPLPPRQPGPLRLLFAALNREASWRWILPALNACLAQWGDKICIDVVYDAALHQALETPHKRFHPLLSHQDYMALLANSDVHLSPLLDTVFNCAKSDLKFIESAAAGAVFLGSGAVYHASVVSEHTGLLFETAEEMAAQLSALIAQPDRLERLRRAAYAYVCGERLLSQHIHRHHQWYAGLVAQRLTLHDHLRARRPEFNLPDWRS